MSVKQRAQQYSQQHRHQGGNIGLKDNQTDVVPTAISTYQFPRPWGIVDGELVEVMSQETNIPGMSPGFWIREDTTQGITAPVSYTEIQLFSNEGAARQALLAQRSSLVR